MTRVIRWIGIPLVAFATSAYAAGFPSAEFSTHQVVGGPAFVCPEGDGQSLGEQGVHVLITLHDEQGQPVPGFPGENDELLMNQVGGPCGGDYVVDGPSDAQGQTRFSMPLINGGQFSQELVFIPLPGQLPGVMYIGDLVQLVVNSADIDANGTVDLADVGAFAGDLSLAQHGAILPRSDFNHDGRLDLADVGILAEHMGHTCHGL